MRAALPAAYRGSSAFISARGSRSGMPGARLRTTATRYRRPAASAVRRAGRARPSRRARSGSHTCCRSVRWVATVPGALFHLYLVDQAVPVVVQTFDLQQRFAGRRFADTQGPDLEPCWPGRPPPCRRLAAAPLRPAPCRIPTPVRPSAVPQSTLLSFSPLWQRDVKGAHLLIQARATNNRGGRRSQEKRRRPQVRFDQRTEPSWKAAA